MKRGRKVIVVVSSNVDDGVILRNVFKTNYLVIEAKSFNDFSAILLHSYHSIDLILLNSDEIETINDEIKLIHETSEYRKIPFVVVSNIQEEKHELYILKSGASDYIKRPSGLEIIFQRADRIVERNLQEKISLTKAIQKEVSETQKQLDDVTTSIDGGFLTIQFVKNNVEFLYINKTLLDLLQYNSFTTRTMIKRLLSDIGTLPKEVKEKIRNRENFDLNSTIHKKDNGLIWVKTHAIFLRNDPKGPIYNCVIINDTDAKVDSIEKEEALEELTYRANFDDLTGLHNKSKFIFEANKKMNLLSDTKFGLIVLNIVKFKIINELLGRKTGEGILLEMAKYLSEGKYSNNLIAKLENDHFVLLFQKDDFDVTKCILDVEKHLTDIFKTIPIFINSGVYIEEELNKNAEIMIDRAKLALESISDNYNDKSRYYNEDIKNAIVQEQDLIAKFDKALRNKEFVPFYQPIYSISDGTPKSVEALARWIDPIKGTIISPAQFIPIFEKDGLIDKLDECIWEEAAKYLRKRIDQGKKIIPIEVNVSRLSLMKSNFLEIIKSLFDRYKLDKSMLRFEITETIYIGNTTKVSRIIKELQDLGIMVLMDDFGSGFSSINMLKDVQFDIIKIDSKFSQGFEYSKRSGSLFSSVVKMITWLDSKIIVEGIETDQQIAFLRSIGVENVQGYYYSKPLSENDFSILLDSCKKIDTKKIDEINDFDIESAFSGNAFFNKILNSSFGNFGIYEFDGKHLGILRINENYKKTFGYKSNDELSKIMKDVLPNLPPESRKVLVEACKKCIKTKVSQKVFVERYDINKVPLKHIINVSYLGKKDKHIISIAGIDIDEVTAISK